MSDETFWVTCRPCPVCGLQSQLLVPTGGYVNWLWGDYIQNAIPELSADQREQLISGTCPGCWKELYSDE